MLNRCRLSDARARQIAATRIRNQAQDKFSAVWPGKHGHAKSFNVVFADNDLCLQVRNLGSQRCTVF